MNCRGAYSPSFTRSEAKGNLLIHIFSRAHSTSTASNPRIVREVGSPKSGPVSSQARPMPLLARYPDKDTQNSIRAPAAAWSGEERQSIEWLAPPDLQTERPFESRDSRY